MADETQNKRLARARFEVLRNHPPTYWDEAEVSQLHNIVTALEEGYKVDFSLFRIPRDQIKPRKIGVQRAGHSGRHPSSVQFSEKLYCDGSFVQRQIDALYLYLQNLDSGPPERAGNQDPSVVARSNVIDQRGEGAESDIKHEVQVQEILSRLCNPHATNEPVLATRPPRKEYPRDMYHASKPPLTVYSAQQQSELGPDWSETYIHQSYSKAKYHWDGKTVTVKNSEEEAALGGGWANTPAAFDPYKDPAQARPREPDPVKWVDNWPVSGLSPDHRKQVKAQILKAHAAFWKSPDAPSADAHSMSRAFDGIARVLFDAGMLTEEILARDIPLLVWDSAISGGWWYLASETHRDIFPEQIGHYWVWRGESEDRPGSFRAETAQWKGELLEASVKTKIARRPAGQDHNRKCDPGIQQLKLRVRKFRDEGLSQREMCDRLGNADRPPRATWRDFTWPIAYKRRTAAVAKWLSEACS